VRLRFLLVAIAAGLLGSGSGASDAETARDQKLIQGTWKAVSGEVAGKNLPKQRVEDLTVVFTGDKMAVTTSNGSRESIFKLDGSKKPRTIDLVGENGQTAPGIYEFEGDTLRICLNQGGSERPTSFFTTPDTRLRSFAFQRKKR
jgi:uncharacterized protein (TIGR03067 family)